MVGEKFSLLPVSRFLKSTSNIIALLLVIIVVYSCFTNTDFSFNTDDNMVSIQAGLISPDEYDQTWVADGIESIKSSGAPDITLDIDSFFNGYGLLYLYICSIFTLVLPNTQAIILVEILSRIFSLYLVSRISAKFYLSRDLKIGKQILELLGGNKNIELSKGNKKKLAYADLFGIIAASVYCLNAIFLGSQEQNLGIALGQSMVLLCGLFASNVLLGGVLNRLLLFFSFVFAISATPVGLVGIIPIALLISLGELSNHHEANLAHRTTLRALIVIAATAFSGSMIFEFMEGELMGAIGTLVELTNTISSLTPLIATLTIFPLSKLNQPIERIMIIYAFSLFSLMMMAPDAIMVDIYFAGLFPLAIISAVAVMDIIEQFTLDLIEHLRKLSSRFFLALSGIPIANMVLTSLYESVNNDEFFMNLMSTNLSFSSTLLIITGLLGITITQLTMGNHSANAE